VTIDLDIVRRRALAIAVLLVLVLLAVQLLIMPVVSWFQTNRNERDRSLRQLAKLQTLVDAAPAMENALSTIDAHAIWQRLYPAGGSGALQQDFRSIVEAQGITLDSVQPLENTHMGDFDQIRVQVAFNTTIDHLSRLLLAVQSAPHMLRFDKLYVTAPMTQSGNDNPVLVVRGDVVGYSHAADAP